MRALALLGPRALQKQCDEFRDSRAEMSFLHTPTKDQLFHTIDSSHPDIVLIFGGDGTLNRHLHPLSESGIPIIVVPAGSGNDLARATGTATFGAAKRTWQSFLHGSSKQISIDLGSISLDGSGPAAYFSCCANIGLDADGARRAEQFPNWLKSHGGYFVGGIVALALFDPLRMKISGTGFSPIDEFAWFVSISNTPTFGGGLKIAPQASITDGQLDITFAGSGKFSRAGIAQHFPKILSGNHVNLPQLSISRGTQLAVETDRRTVIYADGEFIGHTPCRISVMPAALTIVQQS